MIFGALISSKISIAYLFSRASLNSSTANCLTFFTCFFARFSSVLKFISSKLKKPTLKKILNEKFKKKKQT